MNFRIITDGNKFAVQRKITSLFWIVVSPSYNTKRGALNFIQAQKSSKLKKGWRVLK